MKMSGGRIIAVILGVFLLAAAGILIMANRPVPFSLDPGTGIPAEKLKYRTAAIAFVQENEELLLPTMQEGRKLCGNNGTIDMGHYTGTTTHFEPVLRLNFDHAAENDFLEYVLENTILEQIDADEKYWRFGLDFSSGMVTAALYYDIIYCTDDPAPYIYSWFDDEWQEFGNGRLRHNEEDHVDFYLEEIGNGFWYSYISWP